MANTRSAEKRNRQAQKRRLRNAQIRTGAKSAVRKAREAIAQGDAAAQQALHHASRLLDRAASKGVLHRRAASRKISRLALALAKASPPAKA